MAGGGGGGNLKLINAMQTFNFHVEVLSRLSVRATYSNSFIHLMFSYSRTDWVSFGEANAYDI